MRIDGQSEDTASDGTTKPFSLVNEFASMQSQMRPAGQGLGPNGAQKAAKRWQFPDLPPGFQQGGHEAHGGHVATPAAKPQSGLVAWGGRQIDASLLPYANYIASNFPGLRFSSGYRDPGANARANGVPNSYHLSGRALDFSGSAQDMQRAKVWAEQNGATEAMIHNAGSGVHLHIAW